MSPRGYLGDLEEIVLLAVVRCEPEASGIALRQEIEDQSGRSVAIGAVYAVLERLEDKHYIRRVEPPQGTNRDPRAHRFFRITPAAKAGVEETAALRVRLWSGLRLRRGGKTS